MEELDVKTKSCSNSKKRRRRKIAFLFSITSITMIVLIVETYAWFIGTSSITVNEFEVNIQAGTNLYLSLDGENWLTELDLSKDAILGTATASGGGTVHNAYENNTNHWTGTNGLVPVSTDGKLDTDSSRLKLYEKTSITATAGGYRLITNRIDNHSSVEGGTMHDESDSYVAFDLFIKNGVETGAYNEAYNVLDDEAVYLTKASKVEAAPTGDANDYGLASSVRVAFMQIGRVSIAEDDTDVITGISCTPGESSSVTSLCNQGPVETGESDEASNITPAGRGSTWQIWEPNDNIHNASLVTYFNNVCKVKSVTDSVVSYSDTTCTPASDGETNSALAATTPVNTFVVNDEITSADHVDVYDGLNGYTIPDDYKLTQSKTFTDTQKALEDAARPEFFKLAANSITKIRVYIYLEGQDVDNYDLITNGEKIKVSFGFTKDQLDLLDSEGA